MLHIVCWKWRGGKQQTAYTAHHVNVLGAMLSRRLIEDHRLICVTDDGRGIEHETYPLWPDLAGLPNPSGPSYPSCYRRLKLFAPEQQRDMEIKEGDRIVSMDLDIVLTGDITPLFQRDEDFVGWRAEGKHREVVLNGSLFMFRAGKMADIWSRFDSERSPRLALSWRYYGSDQAWLSYKLAGKVAEWQNESGIYSYMRDMVFDASLPADARIVSFHGRRKPWDHRVQREAPWIADHWRL